jgi:transposase
MKRSSTKKPMKRRLLTQTDNLVILNLHYVKKMSSKIIAERYGCGVANINRIIREEREKGEFLRDGAEFNEKTIRKRKELDPFERTKLISSDAMEVMELSLGLAKFKLEAIVAAVKADETGSADKAIELDKIGRIMQTALPYVLAKANTPQQEGKNKKNTPTLRLNKLMNNSITG